MIPCFNGPDYRQLLSILPDSLHDLSMTIKVMTTQKFVFYSEMLPAGLQYICLNYRVEHHRYFQIGKEFTYIFDFTNKPFEILIIRLEIQEYNNVQRITLYMDNTIKKVVWKFQYGEYFDINGASLVDSYIDREHILSPVEILQIKDKIKTNKYLEVCYEKPRHTDCSSEFIIEKW